MTRSLYKPNFISEDLLRKLKRKEQNSSIIKTRSRSTIITSEMVGMLFSVYNGKNYIKVDVKHTEMVGRRFGEFSFTKRMGSFLHKAAHAERLKKKKQKLLAQKQAKKKIKTKAKKKDKK